jgi:Rhomboid family/zinc-ribbon domain
MPPRPDLFVVCKHCGSEVSPYVTECPYCGQRLRRRAPKIPRDKVAARVSAGTLSRLARGGRSRSRSRSRASTRVRARTSPFATASRPYVTIATVVVSAGLWIATRGGFLGIGKLTVIGPLHGDWWKLFTAQFAYVNGLYAFVALLAIGLFGWLVEERHGPVVTLALILTAGVSGALAEIAAYPTPVVTGGNAPALALLAAWAAPDLARARARDYYEGDLLGAAALAAVLLVAPFLLPQLPALARANNAGLFLVVFLPQASWLAGVTGGALGALVGLGLYRAAGEE